MSGLLLSPVLQACTPLQVTMTSCSPAPCCWTPPTVSNQHSHHNTQVCLLSSPLPG